MKHEYELGKVVQYQVPLLHIAILHYEELGYSHANAEQLAVEQYAHELRQAFEEGVPSEIEQRILEEELQSEAILQQIRGGK